MQELSPVASLTAFDAPPQYADTIIAAALHAANAEYERYAEPAAANALLRLASGEPPVAAPLLLPPRLSRSVANEIAVAERNARADVADESDQFFRRLATKEREALHRARALELKRGLLSPVQQQRIALATSPLLPKYVPPAVVSARIEDAEQHTKVCGVWRRHYRQHMRDRIAAHVAGPALAARAAGERAAMEREDRCAQRCERLRAHAARLLADARRVFDAMWADSEEEVAIAAEMIAGRREDAVRDEQRAARSVDDSLERLCEDERRLRLMICDDDEPRARRSVRRDADIGAANAQAREIVNGRRRERFCEAEAEARTEISDDGLFVELGRLFAQFALGVRELTATEENAVWLRRFDSAGMADWQRAARLAALHAGLAQVMADEVRARASLAYLQDAQRREVLAGDFSAWTVTD